MNRVQEYERGPEAICLRCGAITCLVTIAELYDMVFDSKQDDQYSKACIKTLGDVSVVSQELQASEYYLLDPYVGVSGLAMRVRVCILKGPFQVCWNRVVGLMRKHWKPARIGPPSSSDSPSPEEDRTSEAVVKSQDPRINAILRSKATLDMKSRLVPAGPGSLCAKLVAMNEKLRTRCPDRVAPDEVNRVFRY